MAHNAPFAPLNTAQLNGHAPPKAVPQWAVVMPVPPDAPPPPDKHPKLGQPSMVWVYRSAEGAILGSIQRFETKDGKEFRPLVLYRSVSTGAFIWRWESWPAPRPLYGLDRLAAKPNAVVIVCEGERAADAAPRLCPDHVVITSPNGAQSAAKADWATLRGRHVIVWPDADEPGEAYAKTVAKLLKDIGAASIKIVPPPAGVADGWDAANAEMESWTQSQASEFLSSAIPFESNEEKPGKRESKPKRPRQRDELLAIGDDVVFWHSRSGDAYVTVRFADSVQNFPVRSAAFKRWLSLEYYNRAHATLGGQTLEDALRIFEAKAILEGVAREPRLRIDAKDGCIFYDVADARRRVIKVGPHGHEIMPAHDCAFLQTKRSAALCVPEPGYTVDELRAFAHFATDNDFVLLVSWLVAALRPHGPYPILCILGEQGAGKSFLSRCLRSLIDPGYPETQSPPRDERDLIVSLQNSYLLFLENVSHVDPVLADALCRIATGAGYATRQLHSDFEEFIFYGARPIGLNAIPDVASRPDFADRTLVIRLLPIDEAERIDEEQLGKNWALARPRILGALYDGVSSALRNLAHTKIDRPGRLADFERWVTAAEQGLGWEPGTLSSAYATSRADVAAATFEADPVAVAIEALIVEDHQRGWSGTATRLLDLIGDKVSESLKRSNAWPRGPSGLGNRLERVKPLLRQRGLIVERRHSGTREISILPKSSTSNESEKK